MDTFVDSSWYFLRYTDPHNDEAPFNREIVDYWMPIDQYVGGIDHVKGHLLYSRFFAKVLNDIGLVGFREPFQRLWHQGWVKQGGSKMSKSRGNVSGPDELIQLYGADATRLCILFLGPADQDMDWTPEGVEGMVRFVKRLWRVVGAVVDQPASPAGVDTPLARKAHETIARVSDDIDRRFVFNTPISAVMELVNELSKAPADPAARFAAETAVSLIQPYAPHVAEELWAALGHERLWTTPWPVADERLLAARHGRARPAGERQGARPDPGAGRAARRRAGRACAGLREGAGASERRRAAGDRRARQARQHRRLSTPNSKFTNSARSRFTRVTVLPATWPDALASAAHRPAASRRGRRCSSASSRAVFVVRQHGRGAGAGAALRVAPVAPAAAARRADRGVAGVVVDVVGAVARPGLYHLPQGARVADAVARAGGLTRHAERTAVNLAAPLADGEQVLVAARGSPVGAGAVATGAPSSSPVSLSSATVEQLDTLARCRAGDRAEDRRVPAAARPVHVGRGARRDPGHRACADRRSEGAGRPVTRLLPAHVVVGAAVVGLALANAVRIAPWPALVGCGRGVPCGACVSTVRTSLPAAAVLVLVLGVGVGERAARRARPQRARAATSAAPGVSSSSSPARPRAGLFAQRQPARARTLRGPAVDERVQLDLPLGRAPPQGAIISALAVVRAPRGPQNGFDERRWLRRQGVHVVLHVDEWHVVGRRGGLGGVADRLRAWLRRACAPGLTGERRAVLEGVVLGDDAGLSDGLKTSFRRSGLYHLLAVSGQNVVLIALGRARARVAARARLVRSATSQRSPRSAPTCSRSARSRR